MIKWYLGLFMKKKTERILMIDQNNYHTCSFCHQYFGKGYQVKGVISNEGGKACSQCLVQLKEFLKQWDNMPTKE